MKPIALALAICGAPEPSTLSDIDAQLAALKQEVQRLEKERDKYRGNQVQVIIRNPEGLKQK